MMEVPSFERRDVMSKTSAHHSNTKHRSRIQHYSLDDLFDDDELALKLKISQHRIMKSFDYATYWSHGKMRGTDNFIVRVGPRQKDLVEHIFCSVITGRRSGIVTVSDLPREIEGSASTLQQVARSAERRLLAIQLSFMVQDGDIWFDEQVPGTWNVRPSLMDDYRLNRQISAEAKRVDQRLRRESLHGGGRLMVVH